MSKPRARYDYNLDAWTNSASGMGVSGIDKQVNTTYSVTGLLNHQTLSNLYHYDWLSRKIVDRPAADATKRGISIDENIKAELERLNLRNKLRDAVAWSRLFGGAALVLVVDDGKEASEPLDTESVKRVVDVMVLDRHYLSADGIDTDVFSTTYGQPEFWRVNGGELFHRSRVVIFSGAPVTYEQRIAENGFGMSYIQAYYDAIRMYQSSVSDVRHIMSENGIGILKVPGLSASGKSPREAVQRRLNAFNEGKSVFRSAAIDAMEEYSFVHRQLGGLDSLMEQFMTVVSGAVDMPALVLFGKSPSGLNSSQEEILSVYYDSVRDIQEGDMMRAINLVTQCVNGGEVPEWDYLPLSEPSSTQMATIRLQEAQAAQIIADVAGLTGEAVVQHLNQTGAFMLDVEAVDDEVPPEAELDV